ncbi:efflux RND transporter permease subunit [Rhodovulum adriaticum]|nr:MMPL family transporter [Rhodovulum adriaticum]
MPPLPDSGAWSDRLARLLVRHHLLALLLGGLLVLVSVLGVLRVGYTADNRVYFGERNADYQAFERLGDIYALSETVLFAFVGDTDLCTPPVLEGLRDFTAEAWLLPDALRVDSIANFQHSESRGDEIIVESLIPEDGALSAAQAQRIKRIAETSDELLNRLISPGCRALGVSVNLVPEGNATVSRTEVARIARSLQAEWQDRLPGLRIHVSGTVIGDAAISAAAERDTRLLVPAGFACVSVLMALGLGTFSGWLGTTLVTLGGALATLGFAGWLGIALIPATAVSPLAVMVLVSASCVHVVLGWTRRIAEGQDRTAATVAAVEENLSAITVTNLTTAIGFLCLNFSESPPLAQMGTIVSLGIVVGWLLTVLALPAMLLRLPDLRFRPLRLSPAALERLAGFALNQRGILTVFALLFLVSLAGLAQIRFNDSPLKYFDESFAFRTDSDAIEAALTGIESVQFSLDSGAEGSVFAPAFLNRVDRFATWMRQQDDVVFVGSLSDIVKRLNHTLGDGGPGGHDIAPTQAANAQAMMLYELSLPAGLDMNQMLNIDRTQTRVVVLLRDVDGQAIVDFADTAEAWLRANEPAIATQAVGFGVAFSKLTQRNNRAMVYGMLTVLVLVSGLMILTLRDLRLGLVSLVPNVLPAIFGFGLWGWFVGEVNLGSTVVTTMTFGIVVDDTVHILTHYRRRRRHGLEREEALRQTFRTVGAAVMVSSVAIFSGFAVMTQSGFALNQHMGGLTALVIVLALLTDLLLLPAVLRRTNQ